METTRNSTDRKLMTNSDLYSGSGGNTTKLSKYVGPDNQDRALVMRGLPYRVTDDDVIQFFKGYANLTSDDIYIEEFNGKRTGSALVIFESKDVA